MSDLAQRGKQAAEQKNQARLANIPTPTDKPPETGHYTGGFDPAAPQGERHRVKLPDDSTVYGEFISPNAPTDGTQVAAYYSGGDKWLFDCK